MDKPMVKINDLQLSLVGGAGPVNILRGVDLCIKAGETISIVGPSGAGKTTLLMALSGIADPQGRARSALNNTGLGERLDHFPGELSGGEQQRVALARAFVANPSILLADEPTGNLDRDTGSKVMELLFDMQKEHGTTLVLVTHDESLAKQCDRTIQMIDGRLQDITGGSR